WKGVTHLSSSCVTFDGYLFPPLCNWQHCGFWYRHSRFESWWGSMTSEDQQAQAPTHSEQGLFSPRLSQKLIGKPPNSDLPNVEQNGLRFSTAFAFHNIGAQIISAKTTLD